MLSLVLKIGPCAGKVNVPAPPEAMTPNPATPIIWLINPIWENAGTPIAILFMVGRIVPIEASKPTPVMLTFAFMGIEMVTVPASAVTGVPIIKADIVKAFAAVVAITPGIVKVTDDEAETIPADVVLKTPITLMLADLVIEIVPADEVATTPDMIVLADEVKETIPADAVVTTPVTIVFAEDEGIVVPAEAVLNTPVIVGEILSIAVPATAVPKTPPNTILADGVGRPAAEFA
jgi:hypothetical protein